MSDLISRSKTYERIDTIRTAGEVFGGDRGDWQTIHAVLDAALEVVEQMPTIEPPVVHASWVQPLPVNGDMVEYVDYIQYLAKTELDRVFWNCSNCGVPDSGNENHKPKYCRWCGAKMDAQQGGEVRRDESE